MKLVAKFGMLVWFAAAGCGDGDMGAVGTFGDSYPLKDQGQPYNSDPGTDSARRAAFNSEPSPSPTDACGEACGSGCGGICQALCLFCPNADLARCVSAGGERQGGDEGGDLCESKLQTCLAQYGCPLDDIPVDVQEGDFE
jgi:hypothetical protein